ncbi:hypothetical protein niasHT_037084 [Heterodera trifolii]|uniref:Uncharacterized protein n=1 Tax=Heterodera trifolii TaxID=157864 RepID=A0ABD2IRH5_9BILA
MANDQQTINENKQNENGKSNEQNEMNEAETMEEQNGAAPADFLGLNALRNAISAIGEAMAELAETSAQHLRQYVGGDGTGQWHEEGGERVEENVALTAASEVGMATNYEQSDRGQWVKGEEEAVEKYTVTPLSVNASIGNE